MPWESNAIAIRNPFNLLNIRKNKSEERSKNLSRSYHKDTLVLTIAGCNKVVYNGFIEAET